MFVLIIYSISEGCTLKLVLAMRGGPINTRRGRHMLKLCMLKQFDNNNLQVSWYFYIFCSQVLFRLLGLRRTTFVSLGIIL